MDNLSIHTTPEARFGEAMLKAPHAVQWLSDNGPEYSATATVLYAHELGLVPITTLAYSPESHGFGRGVCRNVQTRLRDGASRFLRRFARFA